jgi:hypothetical protein
MWGEEGHEIRKRVIAFGKAMKEDYKTGKAREAMNKVSEFFEK